MKEMRVTKLVIEEFDPRKVEYGDLFLVPSGGPNSGDRLLLTRVTSETKRNHIVLEQLTSRVKKSDPDKESGVNHIRIDLTPNKLNKVFIHIVMGSCGELILRPCAPYPMYTENINLLIDYLASWFSW